MSASLSIPDFHKDLVVVGQAKLEGMNESELAALVKDTSGKAIKAAKQTLLHIGQTGLVLIALKEKLGHGRFMKEVEWRTDITHRSASNYMLIARHYGNVSNLRSVSDALRYIRDSSNRAKELEERLQRKIENGNVSNLPSPTPSPVRPSPPAVIVDAEIVEPKAHVDELEADELSEAEKARLSELEAVIGSGVETLKELGLEIQPIPDAIQPDAFLQICQLLPELSGEQYQELVTIIQTRWIR